MAAHRAKFAPPLVIRRAMVEVWGGGYCFYLIYYVFFIVIICHNNKSLSSRITTIWRRCSTSHQRSWAAATAPISLPTLLLPSPLKRRLLSLRLVVVIDSIQGQFREIHEAWLKIGYSLWFPKEVVQQCGKEEEGKIAEVVRVSGVSRTCQGYISLSRISHQWLRYFHPLFYFKLPIFTH